MNRGSLAERSAERYLLGRGLQLIARNFRSRFGEIDLVMQDGVSLVFVEVRLRSKPDYGGAAASIDRRKQQRIIRTAQQYLAALAEIPPCRFDAILMDDEQGSNLQWLSNAFDA